MNLKSWKVTAVIACVAPRLKKEKKKPKPLKWHPCRWDWNAEKKNERIKNQKKKKTKKKKEQIRDFKQGWMKELNRRSRCSYGNQSQFWSCGVEEFGFLYDLVDLLRVSEKRESYIQSKKLNLFFKKRKKGRLSLSTFLWICWKNEYFSYLM